MNFQRDICYMCDVVCPPDELAEARLLIQRVLISNSPPFASRRPAGGFERGRMCS